MHQYILLLCGLSLSFAAVWSKATGTLLFCGPIFCKRSIPSDPPAWLWIGSPCRFLNRADSADSAYALGYGVWAATYQSSTSSSILLETLLHSSQPSQIYQNSWARDQSESTTSCAGHGTSWRCRWHSHPPWIRPGRWYAASSQQRDSKLFVFKLDVPFPVASGPSDPYELEQIARIKEGFQRPKNVKSDDRHIIVPERELDWVDELAHAIACLGYCFFLLDIKRCLLRIL